MILLLRLAWGLARTPIPEHRWRRVAVSVTAAMMLLLMLMATSIIVMTQREIARDESRSAQVATSPAPTDLFLEKGTDSWQGEQFPVIWIQPAGEATPPLPPGMPQLPAPGQAVVSPALDRLCQRYPDLALRYPNRLVLGTAGVRSEEELFAYVRVPADRSLATSQPGVSRIQAFGPPRPGEPFQPLSLSPHDMLLPMAVVGVQAFLVLPALLVLFLGITTASRVRDHRFAVLRWIGAPRRTLLGLAVLETELLVLPGIGIAALLWAFLAPHLGWLPLVDHDIIRGDLALPWWLIVVNLIAVLGAVALLSGGMVLVQGTQEPTATRPQVRYAGFSLLRVVPLIASVILLGLGTSRVGNAAARLNFAAILLAVLSVPPLLPGLLRPLGRALSRLEAAPALLAGRMLAWDPVRLTRPFSAIATLIVVASLTSGYVAKQLYRDPLPTTRGPQAVQILWLDPRPEDYQHLRRSLGSGLVIPTSHEELGEAPDPKVQKGRRARNTSRWRVLLTLGVSCHKLLPYFPSSTCRDDAPYELPGEVARRLEQSLSTPQEDIRLIAPEDLEVVGQAIVLDDAAPNILAERVRTVAMPLLPGPQVQPYGPQRWALRASRAVSWLLGGVTVALIILATGCLVTMVNRYLATRNRRRHLLHLGLTPKRLMIIEVWQFATSYTLATTVSFIIGFILCALSIYRASMPWAVFRQVMPWTAIGAILATAMVLGLAGTLSVVLFGTKAGERQELPE